MRSRRHGLTLIEVLVAAGLGLLVITALFQLFVGGLRLYTRGQARTDIQSSGSVGLLTLSNDLRRASLLSVTVQGDPTLGGTVPASPGAPVGVAMRLPAVPGTTVSAFTPAPIFVLYYFDSVNHAVVKKTWANATGDPVSGIVPDPVQLNQRLTGMQVVQICQSPNGTEQRVATNVALMSVTAEGSGVTANIFPDPNNPALKDVTIGVTLTLQKALESTRTVEETVTTTVAMRNE